MKKLILVLAAAIVAVSASAQVYVGGSASVGRNTDANITNFSIYPEIGYNLNNQWAIAASVGYGYKYNSGVKTNLVSVNPYVRYSFAKLGPVNLFLDGSVDYEYAKTKTPVLNGTSNDWYVGIKPGFAVPVSDNVAFVAHVGFLGYSYVNKDNIFGANIDGNALSFGFYYNF
jgi:hypothetical protein